MITPKGLPPNVVSGRKIVTAPSAAIATVPTEFWDDITPLLENGLKRPLTDYEKQVVLRRYSALVAAREKLELSLAKADALDSGTVYISIPQYPRRGAELFRKLERGLADDLGSDASQLMPELGPLVRVENHQLGAMPQDILIQDRGALYHVIHGSGVVIRKDGQVMPLHVTMTSDLAKNQLASYTYLKPFFPSPAQGHRPR